MRDITKEITQKLQEIEQQEQVVILHAVESGSRAWGFASQDSDYDVRFIYVRPKTDYLKLNEQKDTIEWQLDEVLDINGWDLKKVLKQFYRSNATLFEWSNSPIVYQTTALWQRIDQESKHYFSVKAAAYHYYGTANSTYCQYLQGDQVTYKKYFYALRPLLAGLYLQKHACPPPVLFADLLQMELPAELRAEIAVLLELKKNSNEQKQEQQRPVLQAFIADQIERQRAVVEKMPADQKREWEPLNELFLDVLK